MGVGGPLPIQWRDDEHAAAVPSRRYGRGWLWGGGGEVVVVVVTVAASPRASGTPPSSSSAVSPLSPGTRCGTFP